MEPIVLSVIMLIVIMLGVVMLSVIMLNVIMIRVVKSNRRFGPVCYLVFQLLTAQNAHNSTA
jgi:hypothetical protein